MSQTYTTTTTCDGCGRRSEPQTTTTCAVMVPPEKWASIYGGNHSAHVCSPDCARKVYAGWLAAGEAKEKAGREGTRIAT